MEILFFFFLFLIVIASFWWQSDRSHTVIEQWAEQHGYRLVECNNSPFKGPFFWTSSKGQTVYHVVVEDKTGRTRSGWVKCGSYWWGLMSDQAEVRWEDE